MAIVNIIKQLIGSNPTVEHYAENEEEPRQTLRTAFNKKFSEHNAEGCFKAAEMLVESHDYDAGIEAYQKLASTFADKRDYCELRIALACVELGRYNDAIHYFHASRVHGYDETCVDNAFWQMGLTIQTQSLQPNNPNATQDKALFTEVLEKYLVHFPKGCHVEEAKAILKAQYPAN